MKNQESPPTSGAGFGDDALPLQDLTRLAEPAFEVRDGVVLLKGSISRSTGSLAYPQRQVSLDGGRRDLEPILFGPKANLYSFSTVHVSSSRPTPYTIGYVDFDNGVRVLADIRSPEGYALACGESVELRADAGEWFAVPLQVETNRGDTK